MIIYIKKKKKLSLIHITCTTLVYYRYYILLVHIRKVSHEYFLVYNHDVHYQYQRA